MGISNFHTWVDARFDAAQAVDPKAIIATDHLLIDLNGLFSRGAADLIDASALDEVLVSNTIPLPADVKSKTRKVRQLSVGRLVESAIRAIHAGASVGSLCDANIAGLVRP